MLVAGGDSSAALAAFRAAQEQVDERLIRARDDAEALRDLFVSHIKIGDVLVAQGDGAGALAAFRKSLDIREALAGRDPGYAQWAVDVAVSCSKFGSLTAQLTTEERRSYLERGAAILGRGRRRTLSSGQGTRAGRKPRCRLLSCAATAVIGQPRSGSAATTAQ